MSLTALEYQTFRGLLTRKFLPPKPRILDFGKSAWYGDIPSEQFAKDIRQFITDPERQQAVLNDLAKADALAGEERLYALSHVFYHGFLDAGIYRTIDLTAPRDHYRFDLNRPVPVTEMFDLCLNLGTAEHIFNVYQFFKTVHERTADDGLMMHHVPFMGWLDHGFFSFQPTIFVDLARANGYQILSIACGRSGYLEFMEFTSHEDIHRQFKLQKIPPTSILNVVMKKTAPSKPFAVPIQGIYAGTLSQELKEDWWNVR